MAMILTVPEVCEATGGRLVCGSRDALFTSVTIDSRTASSGALFVPLPGSRTDGHAHLNEAVSRGASGFFFVTNKVAQLPDGAAGLVVPDVLHALQQLAAWYRSQLKAMVIGVAGSNGKTTTKELLAQVCVRQKPTSATQGNLNNHIGTPLTILRAARDVQCLVLELGTSGAGELAALCHIARPQIGIITSIAEEHTETLGDLAGVIDEETAVVAALPHDGVAVVNGDNEALLASVRRRARCRIVTFGEQAANQFRIAHVQVSRTGTSFQVTTPMGERTVHLRLLGSHFALAATAALAVAVECGLDLNLACETLQNAQGAARRMAVVELPERRVTILDDCYNANPASMQQAILTAQHVRAPGERVVFVLGDMLELGAVGPVRHRELGQTIGRLNPPPDLLVVVGEDARAIAAEVEPAGSAVRWYARAEEAAAFVRDTVASHDGPQLVLVKGSRGIRLEEVTRRLAEEPRN